MPFGSTGLGGCMITVRRGTICGGLSSASEQDERPTAPGEQDLSKLDGAKERECMRGMMFPKSGDRASERAVMGWWWRKRSRGTSWKPDLAILITLNLGGQISGGIFD